MFRNYIKVALRNLTRHKMFSFINIFGLALSMSVCLIVLVALKDQLDYDKFHPHPEKTYRIITQITNREGKLFRIATTPLPLVNSLVKDYNIVAKSARIYPIGSRPASSETKELSINTAFTDPGFFKIFGFSLKSGTAASALEAPNSVVLSEEAATKYFGTTDPVGKLLSIDQFGKFQVTGVLDKSNGKSHIDFDCLVSMASLPSLEKSGKMTSIFETWNNGTSAYTYVTLKPGNTSKQLKQAVSQVSSLLMKHTTVVGKEKFEFDVQRLDKIILGEELGYNLGNTGSREKVLFTIVIGFVILLSACFNYTNLSLARALNRGKEVGIRKTSGAFRTQIFFQFLVESILIALLSLGVAFLFFKIMNDYAPFGGELIPQGAEFDGMLLAWCFAFAVFTGILAGALPAWALSSFKPVEVLKNLANIKLFGSTGLRKGLIIFQFALSLIIIVFTITFHKQFSYMANGDPGYNLKNIVNISLQGADHKLLANHIAHLKGVESISAASTNLGRSTSGDVLVRPAKDKDRIGMEFYDVDANFIQNMRLTRLAGKSFGQNTSDRESSIVISDLARKILQFKSPAEAIGKVILIDDTTEVSIAGVIRDFYYRGLETPFGPLVLRNRPGNFKFLHVKTTTASNKEMMKSIERAWKQAEPLKPFQATWLYEEVKERKGAWSTVSMLGFLAIITITLACMGLLGMVVYSTETRRKEIGIRKVMGAGVPAIITLLSKNFMKLVLVAGLIALPVSYVTSYFFLNIFANRISIGMGIIGSSFLIMIVLSLVTIGSQIYKVASANPVHALRTE